MTVEYDILVTCRLGFERVVASYIKELFTQLEVEPSPREFQGLVLVAGAGEQRDVVA
ncbi:MAG: RNA-binding protein, partial [Thermoprotei archaeon]